MHTSGRGITGHHRLRRPSASAGWSTQCGAPFYVGLAAAGAQLAWQVCAVDLDSRPDCLAKFQSNKWFGAAVFAGIAASRLAA